MSHLWQVLSPSHRSYQTATHQGQDETKVFDLWERGVALKGPHVDTQGETVPVRSLR